jgi:hypothetical protein
MGRRTVFTFVERGGVARSFYIEGTPGLQSTG